MTDNGTAPLAVVDTRPRALDVRVENLPPELLHSRGFLGWRYEWRPGRDGAEGKWTKPPVNVRTGKPGKSTDRATWTTFDEAIATYERGTIHGIGFALDAVPDLIAVDLDHCVDTDTGEIAAWALDIIRAIDSYTEISPSGAGIRILVFGTLPPGGRKRGDVEVYETGRYVTLTGHRLPGTPATIERRQAAIEALHREHFPERQSAGTSINGASPHLSDHDVLDRAFGARNGTKIRTLYGGDDSMHGGDASAGDLAFVSALRFWTQDAAQLDRLFRGSPRMRPKWDERHASDGRTYGQMTIHTALAGSAEFYEPAPQLRHRATPDGRRGDDDRADGLGEPFHMSELGLAQRFVDRHGDRFRYVPAWRRWMHFDGRRWLRDQLGEADRAMKATVRAIYDEAAQEPDPDRRQALAKFAARCESEVRIRAALALAQTEPGMPVTPGDLDADAHLLNVLNGTLDLRTGELRPHNAADLITKVAPVEYNLHADMSEWLAALERALPSSNVRMFLQRYLGYSLTGDPVEQVLIIIHGPPASMKSTLVEAVKATLGDYAMSADFETFLARRDVGGPRNDIARLAGTRVVTSVETDPDRRLAEGAVKMLTGGDTVTARFLYGEPFEFKPAFSLVWVVNDPPKMRGSDAALWRRIHRVPFEQSIPEAERDPRVKMRLSDPAVSGAAILRWLVEGCLEWRRIGLRPPDEVRAATKQLRDEMDPLTGWLADACVRDPGAWTPTKALRASYEAWSESMGERAVSGRVFSDVLRAQGFTAVKRAGQRGWQGVALCGTGNLDGWTAEDASVGKTPMRSSYREFPEPDARGVQASTDQQNGAHPRLDPATPILATRACPFCGADLPENRLPGWCGSCGWCDDGDTS